jgi:hypothetical protein
MIQLFTKIKNELGNVSDNVLIKVLKRHATTQHLVTKKINGAGYAVNLYCFNGIYVISDEKYGDSFRISLTENVSIAYQIHKQEVQYVKILLGN